MGQEQKKETLWKIHIKNTNHELILRYTEQEGVIESVTVGISDGSQEFINLKVSPQEFQKITAILRSFWELIKSDEMIQVNDNPPPSRIEIKKTQESDFPSSDPEEWDPW